MARRFRRWAQAGVWDALCQAVQEPDYARVLVDLTTVKAHKATAGQKSTSAAEGLGRSRGGFFTKLHAVVDALSNCLHLVLTPGHWADCTQLPALVAALRQPPGAVIADKAYDTNAVLQAIIACHVEPIIPPETSRNEPRAYDQNLYADRNKAERF